jgi:tryptophan synthase alpha chain
MSRIKELFDSKQQNILNVYFTAGFPALDSTIEIMKSLQDNGVDLIELGMPYSDPLADGPVIQESSIVALSNGMTVKKLFQQLDAMRKEVHVPVVLMGYMNTVLQYGFEEFCIEAKKCGIDGLILPDLPVYEFEKKYQEIIKRYGLDFIFLVTPETSEQRVRKLDELSSGFLYAVSSSSTTGNNKDFADVSAYLKRLRSYQLKNPVLVGFGISDKRSFESVLPYSNGGIIGSAFIKAISTTSDLKQSISTFIKGILN